MPRKFNPRVALPVLDATGAIALAQQIEKTVEELSAKPPAAVVSAVEDVASDRQELQKAIGPQMKPDDSPEVRRDASGAQWEVDGNENE